MDAQGQQGNTKELWLAKSGDRVLGPFTTQEIEQKIRGKEIAVIDEVVSPCSRWRYVRNEPLFAKAVEDIRSGLLHSREDTEVQGYTQTVTAPETQTDPTATITTTPTVKTLTLETRVEREALRPNSAQPSPSNKPSRGEAQSKKYGVDSKSESRRPQAPRRRIGRTIFISVVVMAFSIGLGVYLSKTSEAPEEPKENFTRLSTKGAHAWERGDFKASLEAYRQAELAQPGNPQIAARLAVLMMRLDGQTVEAKRMLQEALLKATDPGDRRDSDIALGLAAFNAEDYNEALARFTAAQLAGSWDALFDFGAVQLAMKKPVAAASKFREAGNEPIARMMLAHTLISMGDNVALREEAEQSLDNVIAKRGDYLQEALIVEGALDAASGNRKRVQAGVRAALDADPDATGDHFHNPFLIVDALSWAHLLASCEKIDEFLKSTSSRALLAICLTKSGDMTRAESVLKAEIERFPNDLSLRAANAYMLMTTDQDDAARASLQMGRRTGSQDSRLAQILNARLCVRAGRDDCAEEAWGKLAAEPLPPLAALTGLAEIRLKKGEADGGGALLVKAQSISPSYLPLIRLRQDTGNR
jgi:tetratricopeptide (TPR) repeat protein